MPLPALCIWLSDKLDGTFVCAPFPRRVGAVVVLAGRGEFLLPDKDFLGQVLVEVDLLRAQLLDFAGVNLNPLKVLALEVVLYNLPLFGQVHAVLQSLIQLLVFLVELRLALWRNIRSAGQDSKSFVRDVEVLEKLGDSCFTELITKGRPQASLVGFNGGVHRLRFLLSLHVLLDLTGRLDLGSPTVTLRLLFLGGSLHILDGLSNDFSLLILCDCIVGNRITLAWR